MREFNWDKSALCFLVILFKEKNVKGLLNKYN